MGIGQGIRLVNADFMLNGHFSFSLAFHASVNVLLP